MTTETDLRSLTDEEIALRAQLERGEWVAELFRRYERRLYGCAHRMVASQEVEDAVQEMAVRMMTGLPRFRGESSLATWVYAVARHTCLDVRRRRSRRPVTLEPSVEATDVATTDVVADEPDIDPGNAFEMSIVACRTALAINQLPPSQQEVVLLRIGAGLSTEETAQRLDITTDAVKARLKRARASLRDELGAVVSCPVCGPGAYAVDATGVR